MALPVFVGELSEFGGSREAEHDVGTKIGWAENKILDVMNEKLSIATYSPKVLRYAVFYTCLAPESKFHTPEKGRYYPQDKKIFQEFNLDYHEILQASEAEVLAIMAQKYLDGIPKIKTFWGMKSTPFDTEKFYQDVQQVFERDGFYKETPLTKF